MLTRNQALVIVALCTLIGATWLSRYLYLRSTFITGTVNPSEIIIPAIFDLTGSLDYQGTRSLQGARIAEAEINSRGGLKGKLVRIVFEDARTNPQDAVMAFKMLIDAHKPPVVIGFSGSSEVMACARIANERHVILFSTGAASPNITQAGEYVFRNRLSGSIEAGHLADICRTRLHYQSGMIINIETDYGVGYGDAFRDQFERDGGTIVAKESFLQGTADFHTLLARIKSRLPLDFIYLASHAREAGNILRQAREEGITVQWLASNAVEGPDLAELAGPAADGLLLTVAQYDPDSDDAKYFNDLYRKEYGRDSEMFAAHAYDAVQLLARLISEHGYDSKAIHDALLMIRDYRGASGVTTFDANGDVQKPVAVRRFQAGKFIDVAESSLK